MQTPMAGNNYQPADNYAENQNKIEEMQQKVEEEQTINYMIRRGFIIKTYGILISQLAITCVFICISFAKSVKDYLTSPNFYSSGFFIAFISIFVIVTIVVCVMFSCFTDTARKFPINYILLLGFTLSMSFYCLVFCSFFETSDVIAAGLLTIAATVGLTVYAIRTKEDFTFCGGFLFSFVFLLVFSGCFYFWVGLTALWLLLGIMVYSLYIVYDTQLIMGQLGLKYNIDDYCLAALNLYIDIIYLFLKILQLIGGRK
jgi:FtsH-binding integral membrane protein